MKVSFFALINTSSRGFLVQRGPVSWVFVANPLDATKFPGIEEADYYIENELTTSWREVLYSGNFSIVHVIEEV